MYAVSNTSDADVLKLFSTSYGRNEGHSYAVDVRTNNEFMKAGLAESPSSSPRVIRAPRRQWMRQGQQRQRHFRTSMAQRLSLCDSRRRNGKFPARSSRDCRWAEFGGFSNRWKRPSWQKDAPRNISPLQRTLRPSISTIRAGVSQTLQRRRSISSSFSSASRSLVFQERLARARPPPACSAFSTIFRRNRISHPWVLN